MSQPDVLEVRPARGKSLLLILGFTVFTGFSVAMVVSGDVLTTVIGVAGVLLFGVGGALAAPKLLRSDLMFTVDATGLHPADGGVVPWADVEAMEHYRVSGHGRALGVRLRDPERYAASLTDEQRRRMLPRIRVVRGVGASSSVSDVAEYYAFQARHTGWHMAWTQEVMNHRIDDVLRHCERLRDAAG